MPFPLSYPSGYGAPRAKHTQHTRNVATNVATSPDETSNSLLPRLVSKQTEKAATNTIQTRSTQLALSVCFVALSPHIYTYRVATTTTTTYSRLCRFFQHLLQLC